MSWRDELRRGAFRGIPLDLADLSLTGGKRLVVEEYPEQSDHTVSELGTRARRFRVGAVIAGDDYLDRRDRLIAALELPDAGELLHPWRGRVMVHAGEYEVTHEGHGLCTVTWDCTIKAGTTSPTVALDSVVETQTQAAAARAAGGEVADQAAARRNALPTYYRTAINGAIALFGTVWNDDIGEAFAAIDPADSGEEQIEGLFAGVESVRTLLAIVRGYPLGTPQATLGPASTPSEVTAGAVLADFWRSFRVGALARACELAAETDYETAEGALSDMTAIADAIGDELSGAATSALFDSLIDLRAALIAGLTQIVNELPRVRRIDVAAPTPAIVLAFDLYADPGRDLEIVARNNIANPLFVAGAVEVLSE